MCVRAGPRRVMWQTTCTVQITSNLTFTRVCSQNPRECASSICEHAYTACEWKYYTRSYVCTSCEWHTRANIASGSTICVRMGLACACTPPSRVKREPVLSCLWSVLYVLAQRTGEIPIVLATVRLAQARLKILSFSVCKFGLRSHQKQSQMM